MTEQELLEALDRMRSLPHETEWVEFKEANNDFDFRKIGKYFSALSNEANLKQQTSGWLILGVVDADRSICGTRYRENPAELDSLKREIAQHTAGVTLSDIHVLMHPEGRVVLLQIPPAPRGMPVAFQGHWYGRHGGTLGALNIQELDEIRSQVAIEDWSAQPCNDALLSDLEPAAIERARANFREKNKNRDFAEDINSWPVQVFLDRARLTKDGQIEVDPIGWTDSGVD